MSARLRLLVSIRFQVLFHSPPGVLFTFPSRYWFTIGRQGVFSLRGWSPQIPTGFLVSRGTWDTLRSSALSPTGVLPPMPGLSRPLRLKLISLGESPTTPVYRSTLVWAFPRSLAATYGITIVFFSSGYLDVSVPRVASSVPMCSAQGDGILLPPGCPIRISTGLSLLAAHRSFSQLSTSFVGSWRLGIHRMPFLT